MRRMFLLYSRGHGAAVSPRWESEARALSCPKCKTLLVSNCAPNVVMAHRPEDTVIGFFIPTQLDIQETIFYMLLVSRHNSGCT